MRAEADHQDIPIFVAVHNAVHAVAGYMQTGDEAEVQALQKYAEGRIKRTWQTLGLSEACASSGASADTAKLFPTVKVPRQVSEAPPAATKATLQEGARGWPIEVMETRNLGSVLHG